MNNLLTRLSVQRHILKKCHNNYYSTQTAVKIQNTENIAKELIKEFERLSNITKKVRQKKPQRPPFMKNVFVGVYDTEMLTYPQFEKEDLERLDKEIEPVQNYFDQLILQQKPQHLASDFMENLKRLKLLGLQCSQLLNAREANVTESCRFFDIMSSDTSTITSLISNEYLGIQALQKNGNEEQQKKYLPQLISGNMLSAFCLAEFVNKDISVVHTKAKLSKDNKTWIINGEKIGVVNGKYADLLLVAAETSVSGEGGFNRSKLTIFLVEKSFDGITTTTTDKTIGIEGTDICNVRFENTPVPKENVLGEVNEGDTLLSSLLTEYRLSTGPACSGIVRKLINKFIDFCKNTNNGPMCIAETDFARTLVAKMSTSLYAMESATYLTSGLLDQYEKQDCEMESTIVKIFSSEQALASVLKCMEFMGIPTYMKDHWSNVLYRDALSHVILNETNQNLKICTALLGLRHAGITLQEQIKKIRNPLFYPANALKRIWTYRKQSEDNPSLTLHLSDYLHPSAIISSQLLEYSVLRLYYATETLLSKFGPEIVNQHQDLKRLAQCAIDIYVMTACLARASRSYCIGLQHADHEMILAATFCVNAKERVKQNVKKICDGPFVTNDENYRLIGKRAFKFGEYLPKHPLTRNF